ncbi:MAG: GHKL domain-containing protein [Bdellovibrionales bacterium]|nr:GHKL domain-containing protein [Bdellovibrionales bacterium]
MKSKNGKRPKLSILHEEIPEHLQELMQLTRLAEMGRLASNVAHELNSPLMVVQGYAENIELLLDQKDVPQDELRLQILEILKACQRMSRIITKMNRMSRDQKLRLHVVDLAEVALNAVDFMRAQLGALDIEVEFDFDHPLPINCDAVQIEQMMLNILSNAVVALEERENDRRIRISFEQVDRWNLAKIWNNGPAIPKSVQEGLMMPFFSTKSTEAGEGAGLGLAVSKAIMQVHGGDLSFTSTRQNGTEFSLSFPRAKENPWAEQKRQVHSGRVIVIDRQVNYRRTLQEKFRLLGFKTESFAAFEQGFSAIKTEPQVAGVLIDVVPGLRESVKQIQRLRRELGPTGLIFVMSNFPSARDFKGDLKAAGATEFFEKPIHADNFAFILKLLDSAVFAAADKVAA